MVTIEELQAELKVVVQHRQEWARQYRLKKSNAGYLWETLKMNENIAKLDWLQNKINQLSMRDWKKHSRRRDRSWRG